MTGAAWGHWSRKVFAPTYLSPLGKITNQIYPAYHLVNTSATGIAHLSTAGSTSFLEYQLGATS
jgi:hypothetical protein